jgi:hypothetical protein
MILVTRLVPYSAMALWPFILVKKKEMRHDAVLINHERIHHHQQLEMGIVLFYIIYLINYLYNLVKYRAHYKAYREIIFEREAYSMEADMQYLERRKFWSFTHY